MTAFPSGQKLVELPVLTSDFAGTTIHASTLRYAERMNALLSGNNGQN
jgi:hypothetical protein